MAWFSMWSVNISEIIVMTFSLPISDDIKDGLKLSYLGEAILDKRPSSEPESDKSTIDAITLDAFGRDKVDSMLDMIDEDALVYTAWPII